MIKSWVNPYAVGVWNFKLCTLNNSKFINFKALCKHVSWSEFKLNINDKKFKGIWGSTDNQKKSWIEFRKPDYQKEHEILEFDIIFIFTKKYLFWKLQTKNNWLHHFCCRLGPGCVTNYKMFGIESDSSLKRS